MKGRDPGVVSYFCIQLVSQEVVQAKVKADAKKESFVNL